MILKGLLAYKRLDRPLSIIWKLSLFWELIYLVWVFFTPKYRMQHIIYHHSDWLIQSGKLRRSCLYTVECLFIFNHVIFTHTRLIEWHKVFLALFFGDPSLRFSNNIATNIVVDLNFFCMLLNQSSKILLEFGILRKMIKDLLLTMVVVLGHLWRYTDAICGGDPKRYVSFSWTYCVWANILLIYSLS